MNGDARAKTIRPFQGIMVPTAEGITVPVADKPELKSGPRVVSMARMPQTIQELIGWVQKRFECVVGHEELLKIGFQPDHITNPYHPKRMTWGLDEVYSLNRLCGHHRYGMPSEKRPFMVFPCPMTLSEETEQHTKPRDLKWAISHLRESSVSMLRWVPIEATQISPEDLTALQNREPERIPSLAERALELLLLKECFGQNSETSVLELVSIQPWSTVTQTVVRRWKSLRRDEQGIVRCDNPALATHVCLRV